LQFADSHSKKQAINEHQSQKISHQSQQDLNYRIFTAEP